MGTILLVEDDYAHIFIFEAGFRRKGVLNPIHIARSVEEAQCYLGGVGVYANRDRFPVPALLLLDWDLNHGRGADLAAWVRSQPESRHMPIVAFGEMADRDLQAAYDLGANACFSSRVGLDELIDTVKDLEFLSDVLVREPRGPIHS